MPLDLTDGRSGAGPQTTLNQSTQASSKGLRFEVPIHLFDAIFYVQQGRMTVPLQASRQAEVLLHAIRATIIRGIEERFLQRIPHLVLLSKAWYHGELKPLLAKWLVMFLSLRRPSGLSDEQMLRYLMMNMDAAAEPSSGQSLADVLEEQRKQEAAGNKSPVSPAQMAQQAASISRAEACGIRADLLSDETMKLLNLCHSWLHALCPFVLTKISRVSFGHLSDKEIAQALETNPRQPRSRTLTAVPFQVRDTCRHRNAPSWLGKCKAYAHGCFCLLMCDLCLCVLLSAGKGCALF